MKDKNKKIKILGEEPIKHKYPKAFCSTCADLRERRPPVHCVVCKKLLFNTFPSHFDCGPYPYHDWLAFHPACGLERAEKIKKTFDALLEAGKVKSENLWGPEESWKTNKL